MIDDLIISLQEHCVSHFQLNYPCLPLSIWRGLPLFSFYFRHPVAVAQLSEALTTSSSLAL
jgi:hypothetical protein